MIVKVHNVHALVPYVHVFHDALLGVGATKRLLYLKFYCRCRLSTMHPRAYMHVRQIL